MRIQTCLLVITLTVVSFTATAVTFIFLERPGDPNQVNRGPGSDLSWATGDEETFANPLINPTGALSFFQVNNPVEFGLPVEGALLVSLPAVFRHSRYSAINWSSAAQTPSPRQTLTANNPHS